MGVWARGSDLYVAGVAVTRLAMVGWWAWLVGGDAGRSWSGAGLLAVDVLMPCRSEGPP
jgi:hypothetical protein